MITSVLSILAVWTLSSIPVGIIVGKALARSAENTLVSTEVVQPLNTQSTSFSKPDFGTVHASAFISERQI